ncbi:MAG: ferrous iron transport protein B [Cyanobacteria bacterium P01_H01_bin.74]
MHAANPVVTHQELAIKTIALAGNPNVGKSLFFNAFTGLYVNVSNFPGTTVDIPRGQLQQKPDPATSTAEITVMDTPGVYGLSGLSEEERIAEKTILNADVVINVVSATQLSRDLFFTQQLIDYGVKLVVAVNQMDEAKARNISIDTEKLSALLGVPVLPTVAVLKEGVEAVKESALKAASTGFPLPDSPGSEAIKQLENNMGDRLKIYGLRRQYVNGLVAQVVKNNNASATGANKPVFSQKAGQWLLNPFVAVPVMLVILLLLYQVVGIWVAGDLVTITESQFMLGENAGSWPGLVPLIQFAISKLAQPDTFLYNLLAGEFGVLTMSVRYILGVLFPLVLGFYIYISILEDCGYLPRLAAMSDGLLCKLGLNGRAVIPLILGLGCVTMATVSTRVLNSNRERTIASTILAITIPCSAQLGVLIALMAKAGGFKAWFIYCVVLFCILVGLGTILNKMLPGRSSSLVLDLPPMRMPELKNIAKKTWIRTLVFVNEAAPLFFLGSLLVAVLQSLNWLTQIQNALGPMINTLLFLPAETAQVFVMGLVRRDFGAAGLYVMADRLTEIQLLTCLIVITLFVPCFASATVIWKERGFKESTIVLLGSWVIAFGSGALLARGLAFIGTLF